MKKFESSDTHVLILRRLGMLPDDNYSVVKPFCKRFDTHLDQVGGPLVIDTKWSWILLAALTGMNDVLLKKIYTNASPEEVKKLKKALATYLLYSGKKHVQVIIKADLDTSKPIGENIYSL